MPGWRRRYMLGLGALLALAAVTTPLATAGEQASEQGSYQSASLEFTKKRPGVSSGTRTLIDYVNPDDPEGKPPAVRQVVIIFAKGTRLDTSAPELCTASDAELTALGEAACPAGSKLGEGVVTVDSGFPGPARLVTADIDFLNNTNELIYVNTVRDTGARTILRAPIEGRRITTDVPMLPGTPPDGGAIDTVEAFDDVISREVDGEKRSYITTPRRCPSSGHWTNQIRFAYDGGVTQTVRSHSPCKG